MKLTLLPVIIMAKPILFIVFLFLAAGMYLVGEGVYIRNFAITSEDYTQTNATITNIENLKNSSYTNSVILYISYYVVQNNTTQYNTTQYNNSVIVHDKSNFVLEIGGTITIFYKTSDPMDIKLSVLDTQTGDVLIGIGCVINLVSISSIFVICRDKGTFDDHVNNKKYTRFRFPVQNDYNENV